MTDDHKKILEPESICRYLDVHKKNQQLPENRILCAGGKGKAKTIAKTVILLLDRGNSEVSEQGTVIEGDGSDTGEDDVSGIWYFESKQEQQRRQVKNEPSKRRLYITMPSL